jgi:hypothetical protein
LASIRHCRSVSRLIALSDIDLFEQEGFMRVDFYRFAPGFPKRHCASLVFRGRCAHIPRPETTDDAGTTGKRRLDKKRPR